MLPYYRAPEKSGNAFIWLALFTLASVLFTLVFACSTPFSAFAAAAVLMLTRRHAIALMLFVWIANQAIGYGMLHYPETGDSFLWGGIIGIAAVGSAYVASAVHQRHFFRSNLAHAAVVFLVAVCFYQAIMILSSFLLEGASIEHIRIAWRVTMVDVLAFAGMMIIVAICRRVALLSGAQSRDRR